MKTLLTLFLAGTVCASALSQTNLYQDFFETYNVGDFIALSNPTWWTTWSNLPGSGEDGEISDTYSLSPTKSLRIDQLNGTTDLILKLGDKTTGSYIISWDMFLPVGYTGYYNLQHFEVPGIQWACEFFFDVNGYGTVNAGGIGAASFSFPHQMWFEVKYIIYLNTNWAEFYVNGILKHSWPWNYTITGQSGLDQLGCVNFYGDGFTDYNDLYFIDNTLFSPYTSGTPSITVYSPPIIGDSLAAGTFMADTNICIVNEGTSPLIYSAVVLYNTAEQACGFAGGQAADSAMWLGFYPEADTLDPGDSSCHTMTFNTCGLDPGMYCATIRILSNDPENPQIDIPVNVLVEAYNEWGGGISTDWHDPLNWSGHVVPTQLMDVIISSSANNPVISNGNAFARSILLNPLDPDEVTMIQINAPSTMKITGTVPDPDWECGDPLVVDHVAGPIAPVDKTTTYGTVTNIPGEPTKCWITSNLGSDHQATAMNDFSEASRGWYWQFNRSQGYKHDGTYRTPNTNWIFQIHESSNWINASDPCYLELGGAWRIPTINEWFNVDHSAGWSNWNGPWNSPLKLNACGNLSENDGSLTGTGNSGNYWSNNNLYSWWGEHLFFNSTSCYGDFASHKAFGISIRCIMDCMAPITPSECTHVPSKTQITWNWSSVPHADGYKWNTTNNYNSATDLGAVTYATDAGLVCNSAYTRYVWAYNNCGNSAAVMLTQSTSPCWGCGDPLSVNHVAGNVAPVNKVTTYGTVTNIPGEPSKCWITSNLGSNHQAASVDDASEPSAGWYWQFNRMQGYRHDGIDRLPNTTWITNINESSDWLPDCDPCALELKNGWRIPTLSEWTNVDAVGGWNDWYGPWNSALNMHASGSLFYPDGSLFVRGLYGFYWSSNQYYFSSNGWGIYFESGTSGITNWDKEFGFTLRCIKGCPAPVPPASGTHVPSQTQITWNWTAVSNAQGYKWNTVNDYNNAVDSGVSTTNTETGLTCNTPYTRYVWAYNNCGYSSPVTLTTSTTGCTWTCGDPIAKTHLAGSVAPVDKTTIYGTVTNVPGEPTKCWTTSNLGSDHQASVVYDATDASAGWYWQFNKLQGYMNTTTAPIPGWTNTSLVENSEWMPANDPCTSELGADWRIPTYTEWHNVDAAGNWYNWIGAWNSLLKLHAGGFLNYSSGWLRSRGVTGNFWSSNQYSPVNSWYLTILPSASYMVYHYRADGLSVRCINGCDVPNVPTEGTHVPSATQIVWNWNSVPGATGYRWNTTNDFSTATDLFSATTTTETGLTCNTPYTSYAWAYNDCGYSSPVTLTQTTASCPWTCGAPLNITHLASGGVAAVDKTTTYGTVINVPGEPTKCWITSNLGSDHQATAVDDATEASAGWYWQFNLKQGYKLDGVTRIPNITWITSISESTDWTLLNDPCHHELGTGWRLPTKTEWNNVDVAGVWNNWNGPWNSLLKLHAAGYVGDNNGELGARGYNGNYWSSTQQSNTSGWFLYFESYWSYMSYSFSKAIGFSARCLLSCDIPAQPTSGTHVPTETQIVWNWTPVAAALGYKWNTVDDYNTSMDLITATTTTETGLTCNTSYTRYVWAYNDCGHSASVVLTQTTASCPWTCGAPLNITHLASGGVAAVDKTTTYGTVINVPGEPTKCWITSNLGSDHQATAVDDATEASAGWYWQFNLKQGYKLDGVTRIPNITWITSISESTDWTLLNDQCHHELGTGWRLPTKTEWNNVDVAGVWNNWNGPWNSLLKLHAAGYVGDNNGELGARGYNGNYWSSTQQSNTSGWFLYFESYWSYMSYSFSKAIGFSVRCLLSCDPPPQPSGGTHVPTDVQITWNWTAVAPALGYKWNTTNDYNSAIDLMNTTSYTETGLTCNTPYTRYVWAYNDCGQSSSVTLTQTTSACPQASGILLCSNPILAGSYIAGIPLTGSNTVTLDVNVITSGLYTISTNTVNNFSFSGTGTFTTTGAQTVILTGSGTPGISETDGFTTTFGSSTCNFSVVVGLQQTLCGNTFIYYEVYNPATGETWLDRNLGASQVATSSTDYLAYGGLFQWGRLSDGHECITWTNSSTGTPVNGTTSFKSTTDVPGHSLFIYSYTTPYDWRDPANDNLWQGISGTNNPCPPGFRVPTMNELDIERQSWSPQNATGAFNSPLKFVMAGSRNALNYGTLYMTGTWGYVWSSTVIGTMSQALSFSNINAGSTQSGRANGFPVRCIKD